MAGRGGGAPVYEADTFSHCLVDGDEAALVRARNRRRRALLIAVLFEATLLAALLLAPLATSSVPPKWIVLAPSPPYPGSESPASKPERKGPLNKDHGLRPKWDGKWRYQPPSIPPHISTEPDNKDAIALARQSIGLEGSGRGPIGVPGGTGTETGPPPPANNRTGPRAVRRSGDVEEALLLHRVIPIYPPLAVQMHLSGTVRLHAIIATDGTVRELAVETGHPLLVKAALDAVRQWRYRPTRLGGEAVEVETTITVIFELNR
jgi:periplasmic protein TonB